jgi:hypothetical protein
MNADDRRKALEEAKAALKAAESNVDSTRRRIDELQKAAEQEDGVTKRDVARAAWVAPLVMTVNMPTSVFAQVSPNGEPTPSPDATPSPTPSPTEVPAEIPE